ncbi:MAG TPA: glycosyltransferase, partial [Bryobacteraceae bacterium]|nr:glycosyltransferase [Bryobacteraceae bacterium]
MISVPILIPAYQPGEALARLVPALLGSGAEAIILVDDGSGPQFSARFVHLAELDRVHLVRHAVNLGKGAALKTGLNFALVNFPDCRGVVTADADGQHAPEDILRVADRLREDSPALLLGVREFPKSVPLRSRLGNTITRGLLYLVAGQKLADTQTGLRGIPATLAAHLLRVPSTGYEFELDMLMACKYQGFPIVQIPIRTIYENGNKSSHFHPIFDSMRIYFLLLRFSVLSLLTAILDNLVFAASLGYTGSIARSQILARLIAMVFNYSGARGAVFHSRQRHAVVLPKYVALVAVNGFLSYSLLEFLHLRLGWRAIPAKLTAEGILFIANFAIQRDFVFTRRARASATDWDTYYKSVPPTARLTRRYTTRVLLDQFRRLGNEPLTIVEIGGANSCFLDTILSAVKCSAYHVVDTNRYGLSLLEARSASVLRLHQQSVLSLHLDVRADVVFSVGLIEHFDAAETREAVRAHFRLIKPGGLVLITFPTPTILYRVTRGFLESIGQWKFPDERPLRYEEVLAAIGEWGEVIFQKTLWPLLLT